jgi:putative ABC transport system ATP-binding protein
VVEILNSLYEEGSTILLITHDSHVSSMARRQIRLLDGHIVGSINPDGGRSAVS